MGKKMDIKRDAKASKGLLTFLTVCFVFMLTFACAAFASESSAAKNPNATYFPKTVEGKTSRELFREGVYQRFADESMITYLVIMHKKGVLAGDPFERTYIGIESVQRNHPSGKPDGSVFMAARLRSPREIKLGGLVDSPPVITTMKFLSCWIMRKRSATEKQGC